VNVKDVKDKKANPYGSAFYSTYTLLPREHDAKRNIDPYSGRVWKIVNPSKTNRMGVPVSYKLVPGVNSLPFAFPDSILMTKAAFTKHHLWVTPYRRDERHPAGQYPNQGNKTVGLPRWTNADRSVTNTDIVIWYNVGIIHVVRSEDWPIMPIESAGFELKPDNFFDANPALTVPPTKSNKSVCCNHIPTPKIPIAAHKNACACDPNRTTCTCNTTCVCKKNSTLSPDNNDSSQICSECNKHNLIKSKL